MDATLWRRVPPLASTGPSPPRTTVGVRRNARWPVLRPHGDLAGHSYRVVPARSAQVPGRPDGGRAVAPDALGDRPAGPAAGRVGPGDARRARPHRGRET